MNEKTNKLQSFLLEVIRTGKEVKQEAISQEPFSDEIGMNMMDAFSMAIEDAEGYIQEIKTSSNNSTIDLYYDDEHEKYINSNSNIDDAMYGWQQDITTLEQESDRLRSALEKIQDLQLNVMTSDQRWGCAFSYAREALK